MSIKSYRVEEFPTVEKKVYSSDRTMHVFGIEEVEEPLRTLAEDEAPKL